jgi:prenyltransferase beta subunit
MSKWKSVLKADPTDRLLEEDNPSVRYWTLKDLPDKSESEPEVAKAKAKISKSEEVQMIFSKIDTNGGPFWSKSNGNIYWGTLSTGSVLWFLAETGLTRKEREIEDLTKFLLRYQSAEGFFKLSPRGPGWWSCFTATVLGALLRFGYVNDERVHKGIEWLFRTQRLDGGWYCTKNSLKGGPKEKLDSCPHSVLNVLWAFMNTPGTAEP